MALQPNRDAVLAPFAYRFRLEPIVEGLESMKDVRAALKEMVRDFHVGGDYVIWEGASIREIGSLDIHGSRYA